VVMFALALCLLGLLVLLIIAEFIGKQRILKGEYHRKFLHISAGTFIAFWPWLISWHWIQVISLVMAAGMAGVTTLLADPQYRALVVKGLSILMREGETDYRPEYRPFFDKIRKFCLEGV